MKKNRACLALLSAILLLTGFSWGTDPCKEALEQAENLTTLRDDVQIRQTEAQILSLCPDGGAAHYVGALQLERVGNVDGAISEYRKALQQAKTFPLASGNLGLLHAQKGLNDEALVELARGLSFIPNPQYHKAMGLILAERKVYSLAIYHLSEAGRELTKDAVIFTGLAQMYSASGLPNKALEEYRRALAADPNCVKAHIGIATIQMERNELDKALEELKKAEIIAPQNREIHLMMAGIYEQKGDKKLSEYEKLMGGKGKMASAPPVRSAVEEPTARVALTDISKDIEVLKASLRDSPDKAVETYEKLGNLYRSAEKDAEAIAAYKEAAYRNSTNSDIYLNLGILYEKQAQMDEASIAYKQAVKIKPDNADAHLRLAEIRNARGFNQEAVEQYSEFLRLKPDSPDIQLKLARIFVKSKENALAVAAYNAVLKQSPDNADANREIANLYRTNGENDKAIEHYKKVLSQQKDDLDTRGTLVSLYVKSKQYNEITDLLKGTVELFPEDPNNHYKLGLIHEFRKDYENAIGSYKKSVELKPDHARALIATGRLYMKTGRFTEAREVLEAAQKADPNLEESTVLLNNIRDEFNPEPRKINKNIKSSRLKKGKKHTKTSKKANIKKTNAPKKSGVVKSKSSKPKTKQS